MSGVRLFNDLPVTEIEGGFMVEVGSLLSKEKRRLLFEIDVPDIAALGLAQVCEMELRWVESETMESKVVKIPVNVNVVPGDQAPGRVTNPEVETELRFQQSQRDKRAANEAIARGDHDEARRLWQGSRQRLSSMDRRRMSKQERLDISEELTSLDEIEDQSRHNMNAARKLAQADYHRKNRKRGRERPDD